MSGFTPGPLSVAGRVIKCEVGGFYMVRPLNLPPTAYVASRDDAELYAEAPAMYYALRAWSHNGLGRCWCQHGIGNPMMHDHSSLCAETRALLARIDGKDDAK